MTRHRIAATAILCLLLITPTAAADTFAANEDASGNGNHLTEQNSPTTQEGTVGKFGDGYNLTGTAHLNRSGSFGIDGDLSVTIAYDHLDSGGLPLLSDQNTDGSAFWQVTTTTTALQFAWASGGGNTRTCSVFDLTEGDFYSIYFRRDAGGLATNTGWECGGFDAAGNSLLSEQGSSLDDPVSFTAHEFQVGTGSASTSEAIYEVRVWDQLVDATTLQQITDPTDASFTLTEEGTELGLYFLEPITTAGTVTAATVVDVYGDLSATAGQPYTFHAEAHNTTGAPLDPNRNATAFITVEKDGAIRWVNETGQLALVPEGHRMSPVAGGQQATLFNLTVTLPEPGNYRVTVWESFPTPGMPNEEENWTGQMNVKAEAATITGNATVATLFEDELGFTALELAVCPALAVLGILLWSKSMDSGIRFFGALLAVLAGTILISLVANAGASSIWAGTIAMGGGCVLIGIYMFIREALEIAQGQEATT